MVSGSVKPVLVGGPAEARNLAPAEIEADQERIWLEIAGTHHCWERGGEPIDGTGPVPQQYFHFAVLSYFTHGTGG